MIAELATSSSVADIAFCEGFRTWPVWLTMSAHEARAEVSFERPKLMTQSGHRPLRLILRKSLRLAVTSEVFDRGGIDNVG